MDDLLNSNLGPYHLIDVIGRGGMSVVYKAYQPALDRFVAVKVLLVTRDPTFAVRFQREARTVANLQHPNILPIYDYGEQLGRHFLAMQYIDNGVTLRDMLGSPLAPVTALRLAGRLLEALDYAHVRGVIHRDIKPANILMHSPRWPMLTDFGIAKLLPQTQSMNLTGTGLIIGTATYMSPEQATGTIIDARSDLYSAGVVLYEMMTGRAPFEADTPIALMMKQVYEPPPRPRGINPELPAPVENVLMRALAKDPTDRYQSASEMAEDLERVATLLMHNRPRNRTTDLYQAATQDFEAGRWDLAVIRFSQLLALHPEGYEDTTALLEAARNAQQRTQAEAAKLPLGDTGLPTSEAALAIGDETFVRASVLRQRAEHKERIGNLPGALIDYQLARDVTPPGVAREELNIRISQVTTQLNQQPSALIAARQALRQPSPAPAQQPPAGIVGVTGGISKLLSQIGPPRYWPFGAAVLALVIIVVVIAALRGSPPPPPPAPTTLAPTITNERPTPSVRATSPLPSATVTIIPPDAVVEPADGVNLRAGPNERSDLIKNYPPETKLTVLARDPSDEWLLVRTPDGRTGWMKRTFLQVNPNMPSKPIVEPTATPTRRPRPTAPPTDTPLPPTDTPLPPTDTPAAATALSNQPAAEVHDQPTDQPYPTPAP